jgi:PQQ-dependent catabolism-associated CXXCW motif protein
MPKITISYRRKDSDAITGRIRDRIAEHFGQKSVFMDIDSIPLGIDFRKQIQKALQENQILLAVIGPNWTGPVPGAPARIFDPADPVRIEVETALQRRIPTIPVLVGGATMPSPSELPESLKELPFYNAAEVSSGVDFHTHIDRLIRAMEQIIKERGSSGFEQITTQVRRRLLIAGGVIACVVLLAFVFLYPYWLHGPSPTAGLQTAQMPPQVGSSPQPQTLPPPGSGPDQPPTAGSEPTQAPPQSVKSVSETHAGPSALPTKDSAGAKAAASACDPGSVPIFYDNFKAIDPAWDGLGTDPRNNFYLADGQLVMAAAADDDIFFTREAIFRNASICTRLISPPAMKDLWGAGAGLVFWSSDDKNGYDVLIFPGGGYKLEKWVKGSSITLSQEKTDAIKTGPHAVNEIRITNTNDTNALYFNGRKVKEFKGQPGRDEHYIGFAAYSESTQINEWRFSDIVMTQTNYADEFTDFGVPPQNLLQRNVGTNTPTTISGARVITTSELFEAIQRSSLDGSPFLLVDVLIDAHSKTIRGAKRIPHKSGYTGEFDDDSQQSLRAQLTTLTKSNLTMPLVFFCEGATCWESYNAALRAEKMGFTRVYWYRGGIKAWKEAGLPMN